MATLLLPPPVKGGERKTLSPGGRGEGEGNRHPHSLSAIVNTGHDKNIPQHRLASVGNGGSRDGPKHSGVCFRGSSSRLDLLLIRLTRSDLIRLGSNKLPYSQTIQRNKSAREILAGGFGRRD